MLKIKVAEDNYNSTITLLDYSIKSEGYIIPFTMWLVWLEIYLKDEEDEEDNPYVNLSLLSDIEYQLCNFKYHIIRFPELKNTFDKLGTEYEFHITKAPSLNLECEFIYVEYSGQINTNHILTEEKIKEFRCVGQLKSEESR